MRPLPCVVEYIGYGGGRGLAHERTLWAVAGYAHFVMDTRGQGSGWSVGETPDPDAGLPAEAGFMTRGIGSAETLLLPPRVRRRGAGGGRCPLASRR